MAISVTMTHGQVIVCIFVPVRSHQQELAGPFESRDSAFTHLKVAGIDDGASYEEAEHLTELGVPFFIASVPAQAEPAHPQF